MKTTIPKTKDNKAEDWRQWKEDVEDFFDDAKPGMKKFLVEVMLQKEIIKDEWMANMKEVHGAAIVEGSVKVWRALKGLTQGEARKVINSVKNENGFVAWQ